MEERLVHQVNIVKRALLGFCYYLFTECVLAAELNIRNDAK
jgi:hypothetical protein